MHNEQANLKKKIFIAGHGGMVGSSIFRELRRRGFDNLVVRSRRDLDLMDQAATANFFSKEKPEEVYLAAARVGGIHANNIYPANFIYDNLMIEMNVIHQSFLSGVKKLLFLGSSCIYPKMATQPIREDSLLQGYLEPTNEPYAIAKIAGIKLCESYNRQFGNSHGIDYRSIMPCNLYGPGDNYHLENSHVIPALIRRLHEAKANKNEKIEIWGSGKPKREFLHVDDLAKAAIFLMNTDKKAFEQVTAPMQSHINAGSGSDISILNLVAILVKIIGYQGEILLDKSKPDGPLRKIMDSSVINSLGWKPKIDLETGLKATYLEYLKSLNS